MLADMLEPLSGFEGRDFIELRDRIWPMVIEQAVAEKPPDSSPTFVFERSVAGTMVPGEELTVDYALFEAVEDFVAGWECVCGSNVCRKRVTGKDWRLLALQDRYAGHFLPLIGKRITRFP